MISISTRIVVDMVVPNGFSQVCCVGWSKNESWAETKSVWTHSGDNNAAAKKPALHRVSIDAIKGNCGTQTADVRDGTFVASCILKLNFEEGRSVLDELQHVHVLHMPPSDTKCEHLCHVKVLLLAAAMCVALSHVIRSEES